MVPPLVADWRALPSSACSRLRPAVLVGDEMRSPSPAARARQSRQRTSGVTTCVPAPEQSMQRRSRQITQQCGISARLAARRAQGASGSSCASQLRTASRSAAPSAKPAINGGGEMHKQDRPFCRTLVFPGHGPFGPGPPPPPIRR
eukprot:8900412-Pyramimonas_sp.AAC.1